MKRFILCAALVVILSGLASVAHAQDVTPPTLLDLWLEPTAIDCLESSQTVTVHWELSDDLSGVSYPTQFRMKSPSGEQRRTTAVYPPRDIVSGDQMHGEFETSLVFPQYCELGIWRPSYVSLSDEAGNLGRLSADDLAAMGFGDITVTVGTIPEPHPGDANSDGQADLSDFNIWNANKFTSGTDWAAGDFNADGMTDLSDFNIWNASKFTVAPDSVTAILTADNHYGLYYGQADGTGLTPVGRNEVGSYGDPGPYNWSLPETFTFVPAEDDYIYVLAWDANPGASSAMWIGEFTLPDGSKLLSTTSDWEYMVGGDVLGEDGTLPTVDVVQANIAEATWETPLAETEHNSLPHWGIIPGISSSAKFLWHDTLAYESSSDGRYVIFRAPVNASPTPTPIPEPSALALLGGCAFCLALACWRPGCH